MLFTSQSLLALALTLCPSPHPTPHPARLFLSSPAWARALCGSPSQWRICLCPVPTGVRHSEHPVPSWLDHLFAIQLSRLDVEELFGGTDGCLLVGSFEALRVSLAFKKTAHLPIPTGIGEKYTQLAGVVGNGGDSGSDGSRAVAAAVKLAVVCC